MLRQSSIYPPIKILSKNDLAKRIASKKLSFEKALLLINDTTLNFDKYWHDAVALSKPEEGKFVRSSNYTPLGKLLTLIDKNLLAPYDNLIPNFIFGGVSKKDHVQAVYHLLGNRRNRTYLKADIKRFFEQNEYQRVYHFFYGKCGCSKIASNVLTKLCCVPVGKKGSGEDRLVLARGFATSTRLALWCNFDLFLKIYWESAKILKSKDFRIAIFIDDIGISASRVDVKTMDLLYEKIKDILGSYDPNQSLKLNDDKKEISSYLDKNIEHLGLNIGRSKITLGKKTMVNQKIVKNKLKKATLNAAEKKALINKKRSYKNYNSYIKSRRYLLVKSKDEQKQP